MRTFKNPITIRSGQLTCPLPLSLESYWACEADCYHCIGRRLNKVWGEEQRAADPEDVKRRLLNGLKKDSKTNPISQALFRKKAFFFGRKADPYQPVEMELRVTKKLIEVLFELEWSFAICSRYQHNMDVDTELFLQGPELIHILVEITPGGEKDRELFERNRTTPVEDRLKIASKWIKKGLTVGVRGEPFIPGYHTTNQFRDMLRLLNSYGISSYNIYNLHINPHNIRRLHDIGLDIEKIWELNQDKHWGKYQKKLCQIADEEGITLGCPDFVNVPVDWMPCTNTCCGINVNNAFTFNTNYWRKLKLKGLSPEKILSKSWEGIGTQEDRDNAETIVNGKKSNDFFTFKDAKI